MEALAGDGSVGREPVALAPGFVAFRDRGDYGEWAVDSPVDSASALGVDVSVACGYSGDLGRLVRPLLPDWVREFGAADAERVRSLHCTAIEAWFAPRENVAWSGLATGSASLDRVASVGSFILRYC